MDFTTNFKICASGLTAQRAKMDVITSNLANAGTTKTEAGDPYRRKMVVLKAENIEGSFDKVLRGALSEVRIDQVTEDPSPMKSVYDPAHPDADEKGFVVMPNVNAITEMADMINVGRNYEAVVTAFDATKSMALKTLEIGK
ncbi:MAG: flagellar basal body rod protein FlgC [Syntrophales bacterium]|jgi:flagellar basal-body rod protein FlgC|nr:flagellar basal body rod protein FlgC [Syntrophales bacterium]